MRTSAEHGAPVAQGPRSPRPLWAGAGHTPDSWALCPRPVADGRGRRDRTRGQDCALPVHCQDPCAEDSAWL